MNICLYSPYFPKHTGGGEKYFLDVAQALTKYGQVNLAVSGNHLGEANAQAIQQKYESFLGRRVTHVKYIPSPLGTSAGLLKKLLWTRQFDLLYYLTDGSIFASLAKKNVLHIQTPLKQVPLNPTQWLKRKTWHFVNTNSAFTKQVVEEFWRLPVNAVHHPMVEVEHLAALADTEKKQPIILHVGRFFRQLHSKRQDVLVDFFAKLVRQHPKQMKNWQLVLIGSVEDKKYAAQVRRQAKGLPIKIIHEISREKLNQWYAKASIYWHATGYEVDQQTEPAKMEHFGISTVEAMAAKAVPIVINKGGQPEILGKKLQDLLWEEQAACLEKTLAVINNKQQRLALAQQAQKRAQEFGPVRFQQNIDKMMKTLGFTP